jgi:hypothetical protein
MIETVGGIRSDCAKKQKSRLTPAFLLLLEQAEPVGALLLLALTLALALGHDALH